MIFNLFLESVENAVTESLKTNKTLVVYNNDTIDDPDKWLNQWFHANNENISLLQNAAVWLKLTKGSTQYQYFEQVFPNVVVPSVYLVFNGKINAILQGEPDETLWDKLIHSLHVNLNTKPESKEEQKNPQDRQESSESFREQVQETTQQVYHEEVLKERKAEREERDRILKLLKADKEERKAAQSHTFATEAEPIEVRDNIKDPKRLHTENCVLQIKLTNSETLTRSFKSNDILNEVRTWVDVNRTDGDHPYVFHRSIPRMTFSESDEMKTLEQLELTPRSALILQPLNIASKNVKIAEVQQAGLFNRVYTGFSSWLGGPQQPQNDETSMPYRPPEHLAEYGNSRSSSRFSSNNNNNNNNSQVHREQSETNLNSRSVTPNVYQLVNSDDINDDKEKNTYNGNNVSLEKNDDEKK